MLFRSGFERSDSRSWDGRGCFRVIDWLCWDLGPEMDQWEVWLGSGLRELYLTEVEHSRGSGDGSPMLEQC